MVTLIIALAVSITLITRLIEHLIEELGYKFDLESKIDFTLLCLALFITGILLYKHTISPSDQLDVYRDKTSLKITKEVVDGKVVKLDSTVIYK